MNRLGPGLVSVAVLMAACAIASDEPEPRPSLLLPPTTASPAPTPESTAAASPVTTATTAPPPTVPPTPAVALARPLPSATEGWTAVDLPDGFPAWAEVAVWTGEEIVFWGGEDAFDRAMGEPGFAYALPAGTWRRLSESPRHAAAGAAGVWTGAEVIVCCGSGSGATAAYDPASDAWRSLPDGPLLGDFAEAVWTGAEMLVAGERGIAAYDPAADAWRRFDGSPAALGRTNAVAWTGTEMVVWPSFPERRVRPGVALDPASGTWRLLPPPPAWPAAVDIAWTGEHLVVWGGLPAATVGSERAVGSRLHWATGEWQELPEPLPEPDGCECNLGGQTLQWMGDRLVVLTGHFATGVDPNDPLMLAYDPAADAWSLVGESPSAWGARTMLAGERLVVRADRLHVSPPGWRPAGIPIPAGGLGPVALPAIVDVPGLSRVGPHGETLPAGPEIVVAATNGQAAISVVGLRLGGRADYGVRHTAGGDALDLTMTSRGDLIVWNTGPPQLYRGDDHGEAWRLFSELTQPPLRLGTLEGPAYPTDDGGHAWVWEPPSDLQYVSLSDGAVVGTAHLPEGFAPGFAAGDALVATRDGEAVLASAAGVVEPLPVAGVVIEATGDTIVWEDCASGCDLVLSSPSGTRRVPLPEGAERWARAGAVAIPSSSPDLPTLSWDGRYLLAVATSGSGDALTSRLVVVDLEAATARVLTTDAPVPPWGSAFWDRAGTSVVVAVNTLAGGQEVNVVDAATGEHYDVPGALPGGYWVLGAG